MARDHDSIDAEIESLWVNVRQLHHRVHREEEVTDTFIETPLWKRLLFWLDGWPSHHLAERPAWRPWRRWWRS